METWYDYRTAWEDRPWMILIVLVGLGLLITGLLGTALRTQLGFFFIPGLAVLYLHHLLVQRQVN